MVNEKTKKTLKWIIVICTAIISALTVIMESGCTRKMHFTGKGIKIDSIVVDKSLDITKK